MSPVNTTPPAVVVTHEEARLDQAVVETEVLHQHRAVREVQALGRHRHAPVGREPLVRQVEVQREIQPALRQLPAVVEDVEAEVEEAARHRLAVHEHVAFGHEADEGVLARRELDGDVVPERPVVGPCGVRRKRGAAPAAAATAVTAAATAALRRGDVRDPALMRQAVEGELGQQFTRGADVPRAGK